MREPHDEAAREIFEAVSEEARNALRDVARRELAKAADSAGVPPEEFVTEEEVQEICLLACQSIRERQRAILYEFVTDDVADRYITEELERLSPDYPEGVPEDVLVDAVYERARRDYPEAWARRRR